MNFPDIKILHKEKVVFSDVEPDLFANRFAKFASSITSRDVFFTGNTSWAYDNARLIGKKVIPSYLTGVKRIKGIVVFAADEFTTFDTMLRCRYTMCRFIGIGGRKRYVVDYPQISHGFQAIGIPDLTIFLSKNPREGDFFPVDRDFYGECLSAGERITLMFSPFP